MLKIGILFAILILLAGCSSPYGKDEGKTVFRYNEASNITSLDPAYARDLAHIQVCNQLYNGLLQLDDSLNLEPCIAKSWDETDGGLTLTFHLRSDVSFHDSPAFPGGKGRKVTARDFVYSFTRIMDPGVLSPGIWVFEKVDPAYGDQGFKAVNDSTLVIRLREPFPPFTGILAMQYCSVVPFEAVSFFGRNFRNNPVGTGPFRFALWKENEKLVLIKNENYFETEGQDKLPYLDAVAITFLVDKQSAFLEFVKGKLDFISGLDQSYKDELLTKDGQLKAKYQEKFRMESEPYLNTEYIGILADTSLAILRESPLAKKEIRQAMNYGFDRVRMIKYLRNNLGTPGIYGIIPPGLPAFSDAQVFYEYDPARARVLIRKAGYVNADEIPSMTLHTTPEYVDIFKFFQHQMQEIGLKVNIEVNPAATLMELKSRSKIAMFRASWIADYPDAENYFALFTGRNMAPSGPNYTRFNVPAYDSLYFVSQSSTDESRRLGCFQQMNQMIMEEAPVIVLYYDRVARFTHKNVIGLGSNPMNILHLKHVKK
jgi:peptide/nickel transport system substrate-binding protein